MRSFRVGDALDCLIFRASARKDPTARALPYSARALGNVLAKQEVKELPEKSPLPPVSLTRAHVGILNFANLASRLVRRAETSNDPISKKPD